MGILKNLVNAKVSGNVGSMNFRKRGSQTVVAERSYSNSSKGEGASLLQRQHRSRLANIVNFFRIINAIQARAWQNKPQNTSDFNMLSKYNLASSPIFLTKQEALAHACVIAPYEVSRGSLPSLTQGFATDGFKVGLNIGDEFEFGQNTLGAFSTAVIDNNEDWLNGDKLSIALLTHSMVNVAGFSVPRVAVKYVELTLDTESSLRLTDIANVADAAFGHDAEGDMYCGALCSAAFAIHSRKVMGVLETSSQSVVLKTLSDPIYVKYSGEAQKFAAMDSYGYQSDVLLTPGAVEEVAPEEVVIASVSSVTYAGSPIADGAAVQGNGALVISGTDLTRKNVQVIMNGITFVPQTNTKVEQKYSISTTGTLVVKVNGEAYITATIEAAPVAVTSIKFGTRTFNSPQSNMSESGNSDYEVVVSGSELGALSATGGTLSNIGGSATSRTATFRTPNDGSWTISVGDAVILSGTAVPGYF